MRPSFLPPQSLDCRSYRYELACTMLWSWLLTPFATCSYWFPHPSSYYVTSYLNVELLPNFLGWNTDSYHWVYMTLRLPGLKSIWHSVSHILLYSIFHKFFSSSTNLSHASRTSPFPNSSVHFNCGPLWGPTSKNQHWRRVVGRMKGSRRESKEM